MATISDLRNTPRPCPDDALASLIEHYVDGDEHSRKLARLEHARGVHDLLEQMLLQRAVTAGVPVIHDEAHLLLALAWSFAGSRDLGLPRAAGAHRPSLRAVGFYCGTGGDAVVHGVAAALLGRVVPAQPGNPVAAARRQRAAGALHAAIDVALDWAGSTVTAA